MFNLFAIDEYGVLHATATFSTVQDVEFALENLHSALENATVSQAYLIQQSITELENQLADYKQFSA